MHYYAEVITPPLPDPIDLKILDMRLGEALAQHSENTSEEDAGGYQSFYDWFTIGGRWAGNKEQAMYDPARLSQFYDLLNNQDPKLTVSSVQAGKQKLSTPEMEALVDRLWKEAFPDSTAEHCPIFAHSNDQYASESALGGDVMRYKDVPWANISCARFIVLNADWKVHYMLEHEYWNGYTFQETSWDGSLKDGLEKLQERAKMWTDDWREQHMPKDDWLVVTVDYHS